VSWYTTWATARRSITRVVSRASSEGGTEPSTPPDQIGPRVTGWRDGCQCGWRGTQFYLRAEWPDTAYAHAPDAVEQQCRAEWERHLHVALQPHPQDQHVANRTSGPAR
jgi:hypothetical protein